MRIFSVLIGVACLIVALSFTVWVGRYSQVSTPPAPPQPLEQTIPDPPSTSKTPEADDLAKVTHDHDHPNDPNSQNRKEEEAPPIASTGPYPKAVIDQETHDFGVMQTDTIGTYKFQIRNEGKANLSLRRGTSTCMCTRFDILKTEVLPGEVADILVSWKPTSADPIFQQSLAVKTNDPENQEVRLRVKGEVVQQLVMTPAKPWNITLIGTEPLTYKGTLTSKVIDNLEIERVEIENPELLSINVSKLPPDDELMAVKKNKTGYQIEAVLSPDIPVGKFKLGAILHTDHPDAKQVEIVIEGNRVGAIRILPTFGVRWSLDENKLVLGKFLSNEGKKVTLTMIVSDLEEEFKITDVETSPTTMKYSLEKDDKVTEPGQQRFLFTIEVPPGPILTRNKENPGYIKFRSNHHQYPEYTIKVEFMAL